MVSSLRSMTWVQGSNLKYISDLRPDIVKLDRGLIAGLARGTRLYRLVTAIVNLCVDMGAKVVAEGVRTPKSSSLRLIPAHIMARASSLRAQHLSRPHHLGLPDQNVDVIPTPTS